MLSPVTSDPEVPYLVSAAEAEGAHRMAKLYQVVVSGVRGGKVPIDLCNTEEQFKSMTVEQLREKIRQRFPETADGNLRLIFTDKSLDEDKKPLSEYGIQQMSVIQVVLRLPGGLKAGPRQAPPTAADGANA